MNAKGYRDIARTARRVYVMMVVIVLVGVWGLFTGSLWLLTTLWGYLP